MNGKSIFEITIYLTFLLLSIKPLGLYIARVYEETPHFMDKYLGTCIRRIYRFCGIRRNYEMNWKEYSVSMLLFNFLGILFVYAIQRLQIFLPLNPQGFSSVEPSLAFNTATSFATNSDWQAYSGESSLSYFTQMIALTVQNFLSAASGLCVLVAFIRGLRKQETYGLGNFWVDLVRGTFYIFLPLSIILAFILVSQGVIQNLKPYQKVSLIQPVQYPDHTLNDGEPSEKIMLGNSKSQTPSLTDQLIPMGPVASQVAIKQLGTNGGGFFNTNSAHPFENPTPVSNFIEMLAIMLIPMALCYTFGIMVKDTRQGWAIFFAMFIIFIPLMLTTIYIETQENPMVKKQFGNQITQHAGNMEGKETRFGATTSSLWAAASAATGNGSVNSMLDSFLPLSGLICLLLIDLGEAIFGGIGSGLYQILLYVFITVFISGLMVGRTPEYLGKKIEAYEIKMASFAILLMPILVLVCTALGVVTDAGLSSLGNPKMHGFSEVLYAFSSMANNNGSAFSGLNVNTTFYNILGGIVMMLGRYWIAISLLAIAGSLVQKKAVPVSAGTLVTHTPQFVILLVCICLIIGALTFFPALSLGPIVEQLMLYNT